MDHQQDTFTESNGAEKENGVSLLNGNHDPTFIDLNIHAKKDLEIDDNGQHNNQNKTVEMNGAEAQCCFEVPKHLVEDVNHASDEIVPSSEVVFFEHKSEEKSTEAEVNHPNVDNIDNENAEEKVTASLLESQVPPSKVEMPPTELQLQEAQCCFEVPKHLVEDVNHASDEIVPSSEVVFFEHKSEEKSTEAEVNHPNVDNIDNENAEEKITASLLESHVPLSEIEMPPTELQLQEAQCCFEVPKHLVEDVNHASDEIVPSSEVVFFEHKSEEKSTEAEVNHPNVDNIDNENAEEKITASLLESHVPLSEIEMPPTELQLQEAQCCFEVPKHLVEDVNHASDEIVPSSEVVFFEHKSEEKSTEAEVNHPNVDNIDNENAEEKITASLLESHVPLSEIEMPPTELQLQEAQCCFEVPKHLVEDVNHASDEIVPSSEVVFFEHKLEEKSAEAEVNHPNVDNIDNENAEEKITASLLESHVPLSEIEVSLSQLHGLKTDEEEDHKNTDASNDGVLPSEVSSDSPSDELVKALTHVSEELVDQKIEALLASAPHDGDRPNEPCDALIEVSDIKETEPIHVSPEGNASADVNHVSNEIAALSKVLPSEHKSDEASSEGEVQHFNANRNEIVEERVETSSPESQLTRIDVSPSELNVEQHQTAAISEKDITGLHHTHCSDVFKPLADDANKLVGGFDVTSPSETDSKNIIAEDNPISNKEESVKQEIKPSLSFALVEHKNEEKIGTSVNEGESPADQSTSDEKPVEHHKKRKFCAIM